jgi:hypothetical protein
MTEPVSDDDLFAFVEGALSEQDRARIEFLLSSDAALRGRLEQVRRAASALKAAFPLPAEEPRFEQIVEEGFRERERARFRTQPAFDWRQPIAAGLALATVAGGGGYWLGHAGSQQPGLDLVSIAPGNPVFAALEGTPSGETMQISADAAVKPILTFQSAEGDFCREVEFDSAQAASVGVACREGGEWRVVVLAATESGPSESGYATVGEGASVALENVFERLGGGDPLSPEAEQALISSRWQAR